MIIQKIDVEKMKPAYGISCQSLYPTSGVETPFGSTWCTVPPGGETAPHHHHDGETFYIIEGRGRMIIRDEEADVGAGDVIVIPPFSNHRLVNRSSDEKLNFISVYWEDPARLWERATPRRALLFSAPPTPNGPLHLGHLSGPYLAADVFRRFLRRHGVDARYVCGSDDNQSYVPVKGNALDLTPQGVIERFAPAIQETLRRYDAAPDFFLSPQADPEYAAYVQAFFERLRRNGKIQLREVDVPFCPACNLHLYEAHLHGGCPVCGTPTNGNGCEECGRTNDCRNLIGPVCNHCGTPASMIPARKYYFPLGEYTDRLRTWLSNSQTDVTPRMRAFAATLLDSGLPDVTATHHADWGIAVPASAPAAEGQVIYAWFEMAAGTLYMAEKQGGVDRYFKSDEAAVYGFFGFDNAFFYLTFIPALLMAWDESIHLPTGFSINQFYLLDGQKFSTSRNHAVWGDEIVNEVHPDVLRFHLALTRPEDEPTNFTLEDLTRTVKIELVDQWETWLRDVEAELRDWWADSDGVPNQLPPLPREPQKRLRTYLAAVRGDVAQVAQGYSAPSFSLNEAALSLCQMVRRSRRFMARIRPLRERAQTRAEWLASLAGLCAAVDLFATAVAPLMPAFGEHLAAWTANHALVLSDGRFAGSYERLRAFVAQRRKAEAQRLEAARA